jgi:hypothetical protein
MMTLFGKGFVCSQMLGLALGSAAVAITFVAGAARAAPAFDAVPAVAAAAVTGQ